jgi:glycosyltransferase involved in cell wall biosynthesis
MKFNTSYKRIYFDARWSGTTGIGRFCNLLKNELQLNELPIVGSPSSPLDALRLSLSIFLRTPKDSIIFTPGFNVPLFINRSYILTIMDLNHIDRQENSSYLKRIYYKYLLLPAVKRAFKILTISEFSKRRIVEWAGVSEERVVNVSCGVSESYSPSVDPYDPKFKYILSVSNRKLHKNELLIIESFSKSSIDENIFLLFTGESTNLLLNHCEKFGVSRKVFFTGKIQELTMPSLYKGAIALIFPSLYEGFGLPAIESMACGTPVLASNTTCFPEILGDAALLVNPDSSDEVSHGISQICNDSKLRANLIEKGFIRASGYRWDLVVERVKKVLDDAILRAIHVDVFDPKY